jgi:predicted HNH restriction endonuclease
MLSIFEGREFDFCRYDDSSIIAKERANYQCEICGNCGAGGLLIIHHIKLLGKENRDYTPLNHPSNLQVLCPSCHAKVHKNGHGHKGPYTKNSQKLIATIDPDYMKNFQEANQKKEYIPPRIKHNRLAWDLCITSA